jgi:hypothetical protein
VERTITFSNGRFFTSSFKDRISGRELVPAGRVFEEIGGMVDGNEVSASRGASGWKLVSASDRKLASQEMELDIVLRREALQVTKTYIVYPGASIIREWVQFKNVGTKPLRVSEPQFSSTLLRSSARRKPRNRIG